MSTRQVPTSVPVIADHPSDTLWLLLHAGYGCLKATGEDALDLLNRLSTNKVDHLQPGHWAPTVLTSDRGRIVDLLSVVHAGDCVYLLTSPGQQFPVIEWLDKYTIMEDLVVEDVSDSMTIMALAGPGADAAIGMDARRHRQTAGSAVPRAAHLPGRPNGHRPQPAPR